MNIQVYINFNSELGLLKTHNKQGRGSCETCYQLLLVQHLFHYDTKIQFSVRLRDHDKVQSGISFCSTRMTSFLASLHVLSVFALFTQRTVLPFHFIEENSMMYVSSKLF